MLHYTRAIRVLTANRPLTHRHRQILGARCHLETMRPVKRRAFALLVVSLLLSLTLAPMSGSLGGAAESRSGSTLVVVMEPPNEFAADGIVAGTIPPPTIVWIIDIGTTNTYVDSALSLVCETNPSTKYVFANGLRLAKIQGSTTEYYHYDHLGNIRLVANGANGNVVSTLAYKQFGICAYGCASEPKYGYRDEHREATPNLIYLHSRWYDPTIGRFLSPDDRLGSLAMPQDQNRYAYVVNNPLAYADPTGHFVFLVFLALLLIGGTPT